MTHFVIVIIISRILKRYSKAKCTRAPAYLRALRRIKGFFQRVFKRSTGPISKGPGVVRVAVKVGVVLMWRVNGQLGQGRSFWRDDILMLSGRPGGWRIEEPDEDDVLWLLHFARPFYSWKTSNSPGILQAPVGFGRRGLQRIFRISEDYRPLSSGLKYQSLVRVCLPGSLGFSSVV